MLNETYGQITAAKVSIPELRYVSERSQPITKTTYSAPELSSTNCSKPRNSLLIDVYALGVLLTGLILGRDPQLVIPTAESHSQQCLENLGFSGKLYLLLSKMHTRTPIKRPSIIEVKQLISESVIEHFQRRVMSERDPNELQSVVVEGSEHVPNDSYEFSSHNIQGIGRYKRGSNSKLFYCFFILTSLALFILVASFITSDYKQSIIVKSHLPSLDYINIRTANPNSEKEKLDVLTSLIEDSLLEMTGYKVDRLQYSDSRKVFYVEFLRPHYEWTRQSLFINATFGYNDERILLALKNIIDQDSFANLVTHDFADFAHLTEAVNSHLAILLEPVDLFENVLLSVTPVDNSFTFKLQKGIESLSFQVQPSFILSQIGIQMRYTVMALEAASFDNIPVRCLTNETELLEGVENVANSIIEIDFRTTPFPVFDGHYEIILSLEPLEKSVIVNASFVLSEVVHAVELSLLVVEKAHFFNLVVHNLSDSNMQLDAVCECVSSLLTFFEGNHAVTLESETTSTYLVTLTLADITRSTTIVATFTLSEEASSVQNAVDVLTSSAFASLNIYVSDLSDQSQRLSAVLLVVNELTSEFGTSNKIISEDSLFRIDLEVSKGGVVQTILLTPSLVLSVDGQIVDDVHYEVRSRLPSLFYVERPNKIDERLHLLSTEISTILSDFNVTFNINWNSTSSLFECKLISNSATRLIQLSSIRFKWSSRGRVDRAISDLVDHSFDDFPSASTDSAKVKAVNTEVGKVIEGTSVSHTSIAMYSPTKYKVVLTHDDVTDDVEITVLFPLDILVNYRARILQHQFTCLEVENVELLELRVEVLKNSIENFLNDPSVNITVEGDGLFGTYTVTLHKDSDSLLFPHYGSTFIGTGIKNADTFFLSPTYGGHGMALNKGSLWSWGEGDRGQLAGNRGSKPFATFASFEFPQSPTSFTSIKQVALGTFSSLFLFNDGHVYASGDSTSHYATSSGNRYHDTLVRIEGLSHVESIYSANHHFAALANGFLWMWGANGFGQLGLKLTTIVNIPTALSLPNSVPVLKAALGNSHTVVLTVLGNVYTFGSNRHRQFSRLFSPQLHSPVLISMLSDVVNIAAGMSSSYALTASGSVHAWGSNKKGELCIGTTTDQVTPTLVNTTDFQVKSIHSKGNFVLFLTTDGRLFGCGQNGDHQLLSSSTDNQLLPVRVSNFDNVKSVAVGGESVIATLNNGTSYAWGSNKNKMLGFKEGTTIMEPTRFGCNRF
ncbi:hypothetical protein RCL1_002449 [Eukaryota sp. TZLM3-RCL]